MGLTMPPVDDEVARLLRQLADDLERRLGEAAFVKRVSREDVAVSSVDVVPRLATACPVSWVELGSTELNLQVSHGGRWELDRSVDDVRFIERVVEAVLDGKVVEVFRPGRSRVVVTLEDGSERHSSVGEAPLGCLPVPLWRRWGRKVHYSPYVL
jgi:hypothetical protein